MSASNRLAAVGAVGRLAAADYAVLVVYLGALIAMGWWFSRREKSTDDFFRGGRRVPWWAAGLSIFGTALSAITYVAIPGMAFGGDWTMLVASVSGILLVPVVVGVYIPFYRRLDVTTPYEYLEKRFSTPVRLLGSAQWVLFQFARMSIVLYLPSAALSAVTGMNVFACIVVMGVLATLYTVLGGIEAVIWTDVLQVIVLMGGAVISVVYIACHVDGGLTGIIATAADAGKLHTFDWRWDYTAAVVWVMAVGGAVNNFSAYTTDQALVQRYMSTPTLRQSRAAIWTSALGGIPTGLLFFFLGTALWAFYRQHAGLLPADVDNDRIFPVFIVQQLPVGLSGLLIAGVFAAAMSSIDSGVNSISAAVTTDFIRRFRPGATEARMLVLARVLTVVIGAIGTGMALMLATWQIESQYKFFMMILGLFGGSLAGLFVLGLFTRRATWKGALVGAAVGAAAMAVLRLRPGWLPAGVRVHDMLYGLIGLAVCVGVGYLASLVLGRQHKRLAGLTIFTLREPAGQSPSEAGRPRPSADAVPRDS